MLSCGTTAQHPRPRELTTAPSFSQTPNSVPSLPVRKTVTHQRRAASDSEHLPYTLVPYAHVTLPRKRDAKKASRTRMLLQRSSGRCSSRTQRKHSHGGLRTPSEGSIHGTIIHPKKPLISISQAAFLPQVHIRLPSSI